MFQLSTAQGSFKVQLALQCGVDLVGRGPTSVSPVDAEVGPRPTSVDPELDLATHATCSRLGTFDPPSEDRIVLPRV